MPELGPSGSARGAVSDHRPYRDRKQLKQMRANAAALKNPGCYTRRASEHSGGFFVFADDPAPSSREIGPDLGELPVEAGLRDLGVPHIRLTHHHN
jgi:hypothetical protein